MGRDLHTVGEARNRPGDMRSAWPAAGRPEAAREGAQAAAQTRVAARPARASDVVGPREVKARVA